MRAPMISVKCRRGRTVSLRRGVRYAEPYKATCGWWHCTSRPERKR